jgi:hypothetical protein
MIAVTIAVGEQYERLAEAAAQSCERYTGLRTQIIRKTPGESSPARYKLQLLRQFPGQTILYYDADARFLRPWDVSPYENQPWPVVVLDWPSDARDEDCERYSIDRGRYFASGFWIANGRHVEVWQDAHRLAVAADYATAFKYEQTALNVAIQRANLPVTILDRRYWWIAREADPPPTDTIVVAMGGDAAVDRRVYEDAIKTAIPGGNQTMTCCNPASDLTVANAPAKVQEFVDGDLARSVYPEGQFAGRGIVINAGKPKYLVGAYVLIRMLRDLGCTLPIEVWYLGEAERNRAWEELVAPLDVRCVDAHEVRKEHPHARLNGFESKPYAIQWSRFAEVLYLDADNVPVRDPAFLFDTPQYAQHGTILWPDYGRLSPERAAWRVFGNIPYRDEPEVESGQIVIDKARCWRALTFANWCGERSAFFFAHVHGDKELFHLCWRKLGQEYAMPSRGIHTLAGTMCQHDFEDHRLFQHRNGRKWSLYDNPQVPGFQFEAECLRYIAELKNVWSPAAQTLATDADRAATAALNGRRFEYNRIGYDHRPMVFRGDGTISVGGAGCERYWAIRDGRLMIAGDDGRLTMELVATEDGGWEGRWLVFEKMGIRLESGV